MSKDYEILKMLIKTRDRANLDNDVIYMTKKKLNDLVKDAFPYMSSANLVIKNNHVLNYTLYGKEIEIINDDSVIIGGFSLGVVHNV